MSQYPIDNPDSLVEAVNYLLSGPTSLGQNFEGMSATTNPANKYNGFQDATFNTTAQVPGPYNGLYSTITSLGTYANWPLLDTGPYFAEYPNDINFAISSLTVLSGTDIEVTPVSATVPASDFWPDTSTPTGQFVILSGVVDTTGLLNPYNDWGWRVVSYNETAGFITDVRLTIDLDGIIPTLNPYVSGGDFYSRGLYIKVTNITQADNLLTLSCEVPYYPGYLTNYLDGTIQPFSVNQVVQIAGVTPSAYNDNYQLQKITSTNPFGVAAGFWSYDLTLYNETEAATTLPAYTSGGTVNWPVEAVFPLSPDWPSTVFTDQEAIVTVTGPTDRTFISGQLSILPIAFPDFIPGNTGIDINIIRLKAIETTNAVDGTRITLSNGKKAFAYQGNYWVDDAVLSSLIYQGLDPDLQTGVIITNLIDNPGIGKFWYKITLNPGGYQAIIIFGFRSFTAQVIKR